MLDQPAEQREATSHPVVAGREGLERLRNATIKAGSIGSFIPLDGQGQPVRFS